ncbi:MAG: GMC family oxidoreductase N-terminal domain-containing protein [Desulfosudaceae bacterium]
MTDKQKQYDAIVVGTGPGGATVARDLARAGKSVLILERGSKPRLRGVFWQYALYQCLPFKSMLFNSQLVGMVRGLITGGSSVFYYGTCFDIPFEMLKSYGIDVSREAESIKQDVPIRPLSDDVMGAKAKLIMKSARELGYDWHKLNKFMHQDRWDRSTQKFGNFYYGDPNDVKWNARIFVDEAVDDGAVLINNARVKKVIIENGRAVGVQYRQRGRTRTARSDNVVIGAGGIGSPIILRNSGIAEAGYDFFFDPLISVAGFVRGVKHENEIPMSAGLHMDQEGYVMTDMALPGMLNVIFACSGFRPYRLFHQKSVVRIMVKVKDDLGGRLSNREGVRKRMNASDREKLAKGARHAREILKQAGATGIHKTWTLAAHPGGTVKIGEVVDADLKTKKYDNLYVCDCSVIPEAWGLPPTYTILSLARRLSNQLLEK